MSVSVGGHSVPKYKLAKGPSKTQVAAKLLINDCDKFL